VFALLATLAIFVALVSRGDVPVASAGGCPNANSSPNQASKQEFVKSVTCLINNERTSRGLNSLKSNSDLRGMSGDHVKVMLKQDCFKHRCNGESSPKSRLFESGYLNGADSYEFGENLGYEETPNQMIDRWMASEYHRENILDNDMEDIGVAAGFGAPKAGIDDDLFVTYSVLIAVRHP
jgi:uncharacterized protein YkwD